MTAKISRTTLICTDFATAVSKLMRLNMYETVLNHILVRNLLPMVTITPDPIKNIGM